MAVGAKDSGILMNSSFRSQFENASEYHLWFSVGGWDYEIWVPAVALCREDKSEGEKREIYQRYIDFYLEKFGKVTVDEARWRALKEAQDAIRRERAKAARRRVTDFARNYLAAVGVFGVGCYLLDKLS